MKLLDALNWRYATKRMTGEKIDQKLVDQILEAARLAPTSAGIQPIHIFSITNKEIKEKIFRLIKEDIASVIVLYQKIKEENQNEV